jgi:anti-sigma factor RsiW
MTEHLGELVDALLDDELGPDDEQAARAHLATCPTCAAAHARAARVRDALKALPSLAAPPGFATGVVAQRRQLLRRGAAITSASALLLLVIVVASAPSPASPVKPRSASLMQLHLGEQIGAPTLVASIADPHHHQVRESGAVSFMRQDGHLDDRAVATDRPIDVGGARAMVTSEEPAVVVVESNDSVLTAVGDDLGAVLAELERAIRGGERSFVERAHDACADLVGAFSLHP